MTKLSVIIPAHNCGDVLARSMEAFKAQSVPKEQFELIVVDDCSSDGTEEALKSYAEEGFIRYLRNEEKRGSAFTRNRGLDNAGGEIVVFFDGDNVPSERCLEEHLEFHRRYPEENVAVLGNFPFPEDVPRSPLLRIDDISLRYRKLEHGHFYKWTEFATTNASVKRSFLDIRFREDLPLFVDTEYAFRLSKKGLRVVYNKSALSWHYHFRTPDEYLKKVYNYGKTLRSWMGSQDSSILEEEKYLKGYLPGYGSGVSLKDVKYALQKTVINDKTIDPIRGLARGLEKKNEYLSVFLYRKLYNYYFLKGYNNR